MKAIIVATALSAWVMSANVQELSRDEIAAAIEEGRAGKTLQKRCSARGLDNGMDIVAEGPIGRIMRAAREAKRRNEAFTAPDVTRAMAGAWLTVTATRDPALRKQVAEYATPGMPRGLDHYRTSFVIKSKPPGFEKAIVLEPLGPITSNNDKTSGHRVVLGGPLPSGAPPIPGSDLAAKFDLVAFKAIPHKDVEVVVFTIDGGEQKCRIKENERKALK
jgi:hypothetical protein